MTQLLQQIASIPKNQIAIGVKVALQDNVSETAIMKMLKSMASDNEDLFIRDFGKKIVNGIKKYN